MKHALQQLLAQAVGELCGRGKLTAASPPIHIERTRDSKHGDFACNLALTLAKQVGEPPRQLAEKLLAALPESDLIEKAEIAGPGFINFFIAADAYREVITQIRDAGDDYGKCGLGGGETVLVEFVSANPTGPLHVGHGRGAAYGDALARVLAAAGYRVEREYYVNDAGRQMDILALSVWLRYLELCGDTASAFPAGAYQGDYIRDFAADLHREHGEAFYPAAELATLFTGLPADDEARLDELIRRCKKCLSEAYCTVFNLGCDALVADIRRDLQNFGVVFDTWFSERKLVDDGDIARALDALAERGHIYQQDGVRWFKATAFGDEKDRVVVRANGAPTYFASDIAYHYNKARRGFNCVVDVLGADHHGYAGRVAAAWQALGFAPDKLQVKLVQFVALYRAGKKIQMSSRAGEFVTLRALCEEVGTDAARFFYLSRKNDRHMDFDLDLAKAQSADNPVYYVQYAHARVCSVFRRCAEGNLLTPTDEQPDYALLVAPAEVSLMKTVARFPEVVEHAAAGYEPHLIAYYLRELATEFHAYYNAHPFLASADDLRLARLGLIDAVRQVTANGLSLLGVNAPEKM